ncbi:hypothetical protein Leryth_024635 [Lithospermum erythrorhizon]|nr:hypothetical protein Leryth_024635 [Lithospermum erythrorhizon]
MTIWSSVSKIIFMMDTTSFLVLFHATSILHTVYAGSGASSQTSVLPFLISSFCNEFINYIV